MLEVKEVNCDKHKNFWSGVIRTALTYSIKQRYEVNWLFHKE